MRGKLNIPCRLQRTPALTPRRLDRSLRAWRLVLYGLLLFWGLVVRATESAAGGTNELAESFQIDAYVLESKTDLSTNLLLSLLQKYRGTNVNRSDLLLAGRDLQREFFIQGRTNMEIVITPRRIVGGVATLHVFPGSSRPSLVFRRPLSGRQ